MTCIAWDGAMLAADKRGCRGGLIGSVTKIWRVGNVLVAGSGDQVFVHEMVEWIRGGRNPKEFPAPQRDKDDWQPVLVVESDSTLSVYERTPYPIRPEDRFYAMGSGRDFATAAMFLGRSAKEAVSVACSLDCHCGNGIDTLTLK